MIQIISQRVLPGSDVPKFITPKSGKIQAYSLGALLKDYQSVVAALPEGERYNLFYTLAHHSGIDDSPQPVRTKSSFSYQEYLAFDIDKGKDGVAPHLSRPTEYLRVISETLQCPPASITVVCSGNGFHFLLKLKRAIRDANYFNKNRTAYNLILETFNKKFAEAGLPGEADPKVFDAARILRLPGTTNMKPGKAPAPCTLLQYSEGYVDLNLEQISGVKEQERDNISPIEVKRIYPTPDFNAFSEGCDFVKWADKNPHEIREPHAFDLFSVLSAYPKEHAEPLARSIFDRAVNSQRLAVSTFEEKWAQSQKYGIRKCSGVEKNWDGCKACPHYGKIPSPLALKSKEHLATEAVGFWTFGSKGQPLHPHYEDLGKVFKKQTNCVTREGKRLFVFQDTHFRQANDLEVKAWLERTVVPSEPLRENHRNEMLAKIRAISAMSPVEDDALFLHSIKGKINLKNGVLDVIHNTLTPHSPQYGFTYLVPYQYEESAECEFFIDWLAEMMQDDSDLMEAVLDMMAYVLYPFYDDHKLFYLTGVGRNGKSTLVEIIREMIGIQNSTALNMEQICNNRFATSLLENKLANLCEESQESRISKEGMGRLKNLSAGGTEMAEKKGEQGFALRNTAKLIFCSNDPPGFADKGSAVAHRLMVIPFRKVLSADEANEGIKKKLFAEIPGILALLVRRIRDNLERNGGVFKVSRGGQEAKKAQHEVLHASSTVHQFLRDCIDYGAHLKDSDFVVSSDLYPAYVEWAKTSGQKFTKTKRAFYLELNEIVPEFCYSKSRNVGRAVTRVYPHMKLNKGDIEIV